MKKLLTFGLLGIVASIGLTTILSGSAVFATTDPNTVGKVTSQATEDYRSGGSFDTLPGASEAGQHAANAPVDTSICGQDDKPGRCGLALNRGQGNTEGSPQGTIEFVCEATGFTAAGCSAIAP